MKVVEFFSGIGSQREALYKSKLDGEVVMTSDWYIPSIIAYDKIHYSGKIDAKTQKMSRSKIIDEIRDLNLSYNGKNPIDEKQLSRLDTNILKHLRIGIKRTNNLGNINHIHSDDLPTNIGLLTYSFPCQDLSNVGAFHGYIHGIDEKKNTRSGLLWQIKRLLEELDQSKKILPRFLLLENVPSLNSERHKDNFKKWRDFLEKLGYKNQFYLLNSLDFGIPQNRKRLFMISVNTKDCDEKCLNQLESTLAKSPTSKKHTKKLKNFIKTDYNNITYHKEALEAQPNKTTSRDMIFQSNYPIFRDGKFHKHTATITTKQDRHPNSGTIEFHTKKNYFRYLTPRESFLLMGFKEKQFEKLIKNNFKLEKYGNRDFFSRDLYYKLFGNSIVVDVLVEIFNKIFELNEVILANRS